MADEHFKSLHAAYVDGTLTDADRLAVDSHLRGCESCRTRVNKLRLNAAHERRQALKRASLEPLPDLFWRRQRAQPGLHPAPRSRAWKAAGLLLAGAGGLFLLVRETGLLSRTVPMAVPVGEKIAEPVPSEPEAPVRETPSTPTPPAPEKEKPAPPPPPPPPVETGKEWRGTFSSASTFKEVVVRDSAGWTNLWRELGQRGRPPVVDFDTQMIVGVVLGAKPTAGYSVTLGAWNADGASAVLSYQTAEPAAGAVVSEEATAPFHLRVVERTDKPVLFQPQN